MSDSVKQQNVQTEQTAEAADHNREATCESGESVETVREDRADSAEPEETDAAKAEAKPAEEAANAVQAELESLRRQAEENHERYLRAQADFDNFRRRTRQEKEEFAKYASFKLIEQLLPVLDNFERAIASSKESRDFDSLMKGIEMTFRQLDQVLEQEGLKRMEAAGQPFNPEFHQAIQQVESEEHGEGIVVEEVMKGYLFKDKVMRPAMVKVSM